MKFYTNTLENKSLEGHFKYLPYLLFPFEEGLTKILTISVEVELISMHEVLCAC